MIFNKIKFSFHLKFCKQYFIVGRAAGQSTSYAYHLKTVVQNKNSQWFIFFCAMLYNKNLKKKNAKILSVCNVCLYCSLFWKRKKSRKKETLYQPTKWEIIFIYISDLIQFSSNYWCIVFMFFEKKRIYCVEFRLWCVMSSAITHYFLSELHNNRKLCNAFINDSSRSYWGRKRVHVYNEGVDLLLLSISVIFHLFSTIRRVISNNTIVLSEIGVI